MKLTRLFLKITLMAMVIMMVGITGCATSGEKSEEKETTEVKSEIKTESKEDNKEETEVKNETNATDKDTTEEVAETNQKLGNGSFDMGGFTDLGDDYTSNMSDDIDNELGDDDAYMDYLGASMIPVDDLMRIVNIELEYVMQMDPGEWTDKESEHPNGGGKTVSSMEKADDLYSYSVSYQYKTGRHKEILIKYDSVNDRADYHSLSYGDDNTLEEENWQQFCNDGNGGYFYQSLLQDGKNTRERVSYQYFTETAYKAYLGSSSEGFAINTLSVDLFSAVPKGVDEMVSSEAKTMMIENIDGVFAFELVE